MKRLLLGAFGTVAACGLLAAGGWYLRPALDLIPLTKQLVGTTGGILQETEQLQGAIGDVRTNLGQLSRQEELLAQQEALTRHVVAGLGRQSELSGQARSLLSDLLGAEKTTVDQIKQADSAGSATLVSVRASQTKVQDLAGQVARIQSGSTRLNGQLDDLHIQLSTAADNFAVIGRLKDAATGAAAKAETTAERIRQGVEDEINKAKDESRSFWRRTVEWLKKW